MDRLQRESNGATTKASHRKKERNSTQNTGLLWVTLIQTA